MKDSKTKKWKLAERGRQKIKDSKATKKPENFKKTRKSTEIKKNNPLEREKKETPNGFREADFFNFFDPPRSRRTSVIPGSKKTTVSRILAVES